MRGMSVTTGKAIEGEEHLRQSIADILTTPIGSRVGRRDYGSLFFQLLDQPMNGLGRVRLFAAAALALSRWEPRLRITGFALATNAQGATAITVIGQRRDVSGRNSLSRLLVPLRSA